MPAAVGPSAAPTPAAESTPEPTPAAAPTPEPAPQDGPHVPSSGPSGGSWSPPFSVDELMYNPTMDDWRTH